MHTLVLFCSNSGGDCGIARALLLSYAAKSALFVSDLDG